MISKLKLLLFTSCLSSSLAFAHAFPQQQSPGAGESIPAQARSVSITFDAEIEPVFSSIKVVDQGMRKVSGGSSVHDTVLQTQVPRLAPGNYKVIWSVVSMDGHKTEGSYAFSVK